MPSIRRVLVSITSGTPLIVPEFEATTLPGDALCSLDETFRWARVLNEARQLSLYRSLGLAMTFLAFMGWGTVYFAHASASVQQQLREEVPS